VPAVAYSVGERGLISQLLCPKFGGALVYGSMEGNSIPGLPTLDSLREAYKVDCINSDTKVFGLVSKPVGHSKGPLLHNPTLRHVNFNGIYVPMFVDDLKKFFDVYASPDFAGYRYGTCNFVVHFEVNKASIFSYKTLLDLTSHVKNLFFLGSIFILHKIGRRIARNCEVPSTCMLHLVRIRYIKSFLKLILV